MFPRRERLSRTAFTAALKSGRRVTTPHLALVASREVKNYAVAVPKQVARLSVSRHRLKRQVIGLLQGMTLPAGLIVFARAGAPALNREELRAELEAGIAKIA